MATVPELQIRDELLVRRARLDAVRGPAVTLPVAELIAEVDAALARLEAGTFGLCETCHDAIEPDRLTADPLARFCLDHLTPQQRSHLEHDLQLARDIQRALLPSADFVLSGWEGHYVYQPAGTVSGDYCDIITAAPRATYVVLGDVSGKGVAASILMSNLHALFRSLAASGVAFSDMVARVNHIFCENTLPSSYATLVFARLEPDGGVELCNAGHCSPLVVSGGQVQQIASTGTAVGLFCDGQFTSVTHRLHPGDLLVLYTDGVTETWNDDGDEYGTAALERLLSSLDGAAPQSVTRACLEDLGRFAKGAARRDDLTLMAIRRKPA